MKSVLISLLMVSSSLCFAGDYEVVRYSKNNPVKPEDNFFLVGTKSLGEPANFIVTREQFNEDKLWDGEGEPGVSIDEAISAAKWFYREHGELGAIEVDLRRAAGINTIVWHYVVELVKSPGLERVPNKEILRVVVLTSGEIVAPYYPARK